jgi:hypothetical protein
MICKGQVAKTKHLFAKNSKKNTPTNAGVFLKMSGNLTRSQFRRLR